MQSTNTTDSSESSKTVRRNQFTISEKSQHGKASSRKPVGSSVRSRTWPKSSYAPQLYDASKLLKLKSVDEEEEESRYDIFGSINDVAQENYKDRQSLLKRLSLPAQIFKEPAKVQTPPDVRYKNYAPSFGYRRASIDGKNHTRWLTSQQRNQLTRNMHRKVKEIAFQESRAEMLNRESQRRNSDQRFLQRQLKKMILKREKEKIVETGKLRIKKVKKVPENVAERAHSRWSRGDRISPLFTLMRAAKVSSTTGSPYQKPENLIEPVESQRQKMTNSYLEEAMIMKNVQKVTQETPHNKTPTLFNAKLARKDSLDVQYKSYLRSMDQTDNPNTSESAADVLQPTEKPIDLHLFLPKVSGVFQSEFLHEPWYAPRVKEVEEMVESALKSDAEPSMFGSPDMESLRRPAEEARNKKKNRKRSRGGFSSKFDCQPKETGPVLDSNGISKQNKSLVLGRDIRFARDSGLSEEDLYAMAKEKRVRFLIPRPEDVVIYEPVLLEGQESTRRTAQNDVELLEHLDKNLEDLREVAEKINRVITKYEPKRYRIPDLHMFERKKVSLSPRSLTRKFENFRQRKTVGSQIIFPRIEESKQIPRPSEAEDVEKESRISQPAVQLAMDRTMSNKLISKQKSKAGNEKITFVRRVREEEMLRKLISPVNGYGIVAH